MDDTNSPLLEKMKKRRAAMEATIMSEGGSYQSDAENTMQPTNIQTLTQSRLDGSVTDIQTLSPAAPDTMVESIEDLHQGDDMMEDLKTRRQQRREELSRTLDPSGSAGAWGDQVQSLGEPSSTSQGPGPRLQQMMESGPNRLSAPAPGESMSLNASIRERVRSKVRGRQARPGLSETVPERRLRGLRDRPLPTRFDEAGLSPAKAADIEEDPQLMDSIASVNRWRKMAKMSRHRANGMPSAEEAYNFFTGRMDTEEEEQKVTSDDQRDPDLGGGPAVFWGKPPYTPQAKRLEYENKAYYMPSMKPVPFQDKVPEGQQPRDLEEEGFYVGKPPPVAYSNLNIMEDRILHSDEQKSLWFAEDGHLRRLASPLKEKATRPPPVVAPEDLDPLLQTQWRKAHTEPFDARYIDSSGFPEGHYQLDVDVSTLTFTHHPLFSAEHVLSSRLQQLYLQYCQRRKKAMSAHLADKLTALKIALGQLQEAATRKSMKNRTTAGDTEKRIREYRKQIIETRHLRDVEDHSDRTLLQHILQCWRDIKALRERQGYTNTAIKLVVRKEDVNPSDENELYEADLLEELQEKREDYESEYAKHMEEYEIALKEWKREMKKRKKQRQEGEGDQSGLMEGEAPPKPVRPAEFDEATQLAKIRENAAKMRRRPGEPILIPQVQYTSNITQPEQCPRAEVLRRQDVQRWSAFVKVLFNDKEVSKTSIKRLTSDFTIHYGEIHNFQIVEWPESIKLQLFESGVPSKLLADIFIPVPELSRVTGRAEMESYEFSSNHTVSYKHEGVGSGHAINLNVANNTQEVHQINSEILLTSGGLLTSVAWALDNEGRPMAPPSSAVGLGTSSGVARRYDAMAALGAAGMVDVQKLAKWIAESHLDPNDPANADIMNILKIGHVDGTEAPKYFRLNQLEGETEFVTQDELDRSRRVKLISLRDQGVPEFKNYKMIPARERDIPANVFEAYEKRQRGEQAEEETEDELCAHRMAVTKFLNKVREEVTQRSLVAKRQMELRDMIIEDEVPDIRNFCVGIGQLFSPRRPLRPTRKERKVVGTQNLTIRDVKLLVNIVRGLDIPVRNNARNVRSAPRDSRFGGGPSTEGETSRANDSPGTAMVRPFIEAVFQGEFARTSVAGGPNPSWNEQLIIPFRAPKDDYSPENLQTVDDVLFLNLFDEKVYDILQDERQRGTSVHQRLERHWLGSIEIPFSTVYFNGKVDGTFRVNTPSVLLGYEYQKRTTGPGTSSRSDTLLTMFVTIEPPLQPSQPMAERFESNESEKLLHNAQIWLSGLKKKFPKREFKALATDLTGKKVFITRYIRSQKPPEDLLGQSQKEMELLARYVSLVPYVSDSAAFPDLCDIWATSEQFLQMLAGDEEEHAILLCNYFTHRGRGKAYVVLGTGIPEGSTAYVLSIVDGKKQLWNAHTGRQFDVHDPHCPLTSIGCVFNEENIWANVQQFEEPFRLDFDLTKPKLWLPFFSQKYPRPALSSVQKENLFYRPVDREYVARTQDRVGKLLMDKIMAWRPRFVTRWNRYCTQTFRNLLVNMEHSLGETSTDRHTAELDQILSSYQLSGFPINMPFTDVPPVVDAVYSTGVHTIEDPDVEFALATHIHPFPHGVMSLWIYVGTLKRKPT
ncbi:coiled-coil and C2 domain-containing protein 2A isoform X3 [Nematostella vectensis]|uniref:coiled-coil and C2 domain-containing protein 2A isoform X3 n=1 Tax=Nematostella vectensis TaxID=45351 RepID=UPI002076FD3E|nr:coiled-coil and C2 domain-containing protein 2A isoform X3 [Nematostella vectensis]